ncbi:hypothetical protein [Archangium violaceum]|uniref:Uncharacterized protein n=1 Tax=Archangium violaceum Cb vi76 TaxID=1406225 RepID=A0A084SYY6_9BACT|nr:hypothetical protein [Archangium violaceum]KFA93671.1 hypothetical protein Q664_07880 [Archangium violaceum Cb vi76]
MEIFNASGAERSIKGIMRLWRMDEDFLADVRLVLYEQWMVDPLRVRCFRTWAKTVAKHFAGGRAGNRMRHASWVERITPLLLEEARVEELANTERQLRKILDEQLLCLMKRYTDCLTPQENAALREFQRRLEAAERGEVLPRWHPNMHRAFCRARKRLLELLTAVDDTDDEKEPV